MFVMFLCDKALQKKDSGVADKAIRCKEGQTLNTAARNADRSAMSSEEPLHPNIACGGSSISFVQKRHNRQIRGTDGLCLSAYRS